MRFSTAEKRAIKEAQRYEDHVKDQHIVRGGKTPFGEYAQAYIEESELALQTIDGYERALKVIDREFGHLAIEKLREEHLTQFYFKLRQPGMNKNRLRAVAKDSLVKARKKAKLTQRALATLAGVAHNTVGVAEKKANVQRDVAEKIAAALKCDVKKLFDYVGDDEFVTETTVWHYHKFIVAVLNNAVADKVLKRNVAAELKKPPKMSKADVDVMSDDEARRFVRTVFAEEDPRVKAALLIAILGGHRRGEIAGTSWPDIVERSGKFILEINTTSQYTKKAGIYEKGTKTDKKRKVEIPGALALFLLVEYREWWDEQRQMLGADTPNSIWKGDEKQRLFIKKDGSPIHPSTIYKWLQNFLIRNDFEHVSLHSLRHTNIALQILEGIDVVTLKARSGHVRTTTLLDTYAYYFESAQAKAVQALERSLGIDEEIPKTDKGAAEALILPENEVDELAAARRAKKPKSASG